MFAPKIAKARTKATESLTSEPASSHSALAGHRLGHDPVERVRFLQRTIGNQATLRLLARQESGPTGRESRRQDDHKADSASRTTGSVSRDFSKSPLAPPDRAAAAPLGTIQAKLAIGRVDDPLEHEADRVADQVMRMPDAEIAPAAHLQISRSCAACKAEEGEELQKKDAATTEAVRGEDPASVHEVLRSPGQPLGPTTRAYFEPRFGCDLRGVRIYTGARAAFSAREVNANAYTVGHSIVFGPGKFAPETFEGKKLLAHELAHVIQQGDKAPQSKPMLSGPASQRRSPLEDVQHSAPKDVLRRQEVDPRKLQIISTEAARRIHVGEWLVESMPGGGSSREELYWVDFEVDAKGVMRASVQTVAPGRKYRSGQLRFGAEFRRALEYFQDHGIEVAEFEGDWSYMTKDEVSSNLEAFRQAMAEGKTREEAAKGTPTGKVATKSGFEVTSVENVVESQPHLAEQGIRRWRVKAVFRRNLNLGRSAPPTPAGTTAGPTQPKAQGGAKPPSGAGAEPGSEHEGGGTTPAPRTTGPAPQAGRSSQVAIQIGTGIASVGLAWLAAYLKARVDQNIAQRQISAFLEVAKKRINADPDEALKKMMIAPEVKVYAWVYLNSAVITTIGVDSASPEPPTSASSPIIDLSRRVDYSFKPVPPELVDTVSKIDAGGRHFTVVRTIIIDIPLQTPSVEDMLAYAKTRNLPLDRLLDYALYRFQRSIAEYQIAISDKGDLQKFSKEMNYWQNIVDSIRQAMPRP